MSTLEQKVLCLLMSTGVNTVMFNPRRLTHTTSVNAVVEHLEITSQCLLDDQQAQVAPFLQEFAIKFQHSKPLGFGQMELQGASDSTTNPNTDATTNPNTDTTDTPLRRPLDHYIHRAIKHCLLNLWELMLREPADLNSESVRVVKNFLDIFEKVKGDDFRKSITLSFILRA